jgi:hypothetical protein
MYHAFLIIPSINGPTSVVGVSHVAWFRSSVSITRSFCVQLGRETKKEHALFVMHGSQDTHEGSGGIDGRFSPRCS